MLIFGRSPNLILGAATAIFNVVTVYHMFGFNPTLEQIGVTNIALGAIIALIANTDAITQAAAAAASRRKQNSDNGV